MKTFGRILIVLFLLFQVNRLSAQPNFDDVEIKVSPVRDKIYMLNGTGGNIGVSVGSDGMLMIDDKFAPLADKIRAALAGLGKGKLKFILNTHFHGDHTGSNVITVLQTL